MNVLFLGRKHWSTLALKHLIEKNYNIIGVVGRPKNETGREAVGCLATFAEENNIPFYEYKEACSLIDSVNNTFNHEKVDVIVSYLFWGKIKKNFLDIASLAPINFHPAPLPEYQGLGGYNAAILDDKDFYGVSAHVMSEDIDAGDILSIKKFEITNKETAFSLEQKSMVKLLELFKEIFSDDLKTYIEKKYKNEVGLGRYINKKQFETMKYINPNDSQELIDKKIRAFWYPPYEGAKVKVGNKYYTIIGQDLLDEISNKYHD
ncbi:formyltransferase family protein [Salinicoccus roseus]|uniref:formyltransferase family protein n=1 Tax=Salinicoccus roseus TaxID=45670 RepID=UPI002301E62C|nr:formyltransferase family protein [Salinicoccus roseus]